MIASTYRLRLPTFTPTSVPISASAASPITVLTAIGNSIVDVSTSIPATAESDPMPKPRPSHAARDDR